MDKDETLRLALKTLEYAGPSWIEARQPAITAIKAALETKNEPLEYWNAVEGWVKIDEVHEHFDSVGCGTIYKTAGEGREPLYTSPQRTWVGLTKDEAAECWSTSAVKTWSAIEAKLKEKNSGHT